MRPRFEKVAEQYPNIKYMAYDIDLDEEASLYNAGHILPVFILFDDKDVELERLIGEQKIEALLKMIEKHA
jgi:thiol-disulfide isomerase/thioredoxin